MHDQLPSTQGVAYLNAGTCGPVPVAVEAAMKAEAEIQVRRSRIGRESFEHLLEVRADARAAAARSIAAQPEDIALTNSTSQGVATIIAALDWQAGDRVVTTTNEHPGITAPLQMLRARFGVQVHAAEPAELLEAITTGTKLVAVSHVLWTNGVELDLPAVAAAAHAAGATLLVDGAQSVGNIAVDVPATGADYYAFSGQKWLLGPNGSGGLWVRAEMAQELHPPLPSYLSFVSGGGGEYHPGAARFDAGMIDPATLAGFTAAVEWVEGRPGGRAAWTALAAENTRHARGELTSVGITVEPSDSGLLACTGEVIGDAEERVPQLAEQKVLVRNIPDTPYLRLSVGAWTTPQDIEAFIQGLAR